MNKAEFIEKLAETMESPKSQAGQWLEAMIGLIHENLGNTDGIKLAGLGSFSRTKRKARIGRNPQTGAELKIPAKWVPVFRASAQLKESATKKR